MCVCVCVCVCVCLVVGWWFPIPRRYSLTLQINSVLTCLCWDSIRSHRLRGHSYRTALPLQVPVSRPDCHLRFWPTCYQWETAMNPSPGLFNLLNWLAELRETLYLQDHCLCSVAQPRLTLCNPVDCNPPGSSIHGVFQARTLEWVDISYSNGSSQPQGWNLCLLCLLHWQANSSLQCHLGNLQDH